MENNTKTKDFIVFLLSTINGYPDDATYETVGHIVKLLFALDYDCTHQGFERANLLYSIHLGEAKKELSERL